MFIVLTGSPLTPASPFTPMGPGSPYGQEQSKHISTCQYRLFQMYEGNSTAFSLC